MFSVSEASLILESALEPYRVAAMANEMDRTSAPQLLRTMSSAKRFLNRVKSEEIDIMEQANLESPSDNPFNVRCDSRGFDRGPINLIVCVNNLTVPQALSAMPLRRSQTMGAAVARRSDPGLSTPSDTRSWGKTMSLTGRPRAMDRSLSSPRTRALAKLSSMSSSIRSSVPEEPEEEEAHAHQAAADDGDGERPSFGANTPPEILSTALSGMSAVEPAIAEGEEEEDPEGVETGDTPETSSSGQSDSVLSDGKPRGSRPSAPACILRSVGRSRFNRWVTDSLVWTGFHGCGQWFYAM